MARIERFSTGRSYHHYWDLIWFLINGRATLHPVSQQRPIDEGAGKLRLYLVHT